ncbi:MAG: hypothetical protein WC445_01940 [Patescibacteria group bacterium]
MKKIYAILLAAFVGCTAKTEVVRPSADAVLALHLHISIARMEAASCQGIGLSSEKRRAIIRNALQDLQRLREEFGAYIERGRSDPYCGSVCEEMLDFLETAEDNGFLSCRNE